MESRKSAAFQRLLNLIKFSIVTIVEVLWKPLNSALILTSKEIDYAIPRANRTL